ncbi:uncharacterized protein LAESUDRAFT_667790 [Laetiporus sulphureus 93-53]|uniref:Uncharacterized protein n=1 Tax=Laetiporus sulphureus 93-53 TaxID=1314785 RepID=A0A165AT58_9APHY|nr:uncharacterized protein LAESUDRAFT_667790 [Laetiporus sulphureus 93-53]KZS99613.1 hypothetical protein LAESUDRAFT_667790 [Laetiporus sulphureus 93-53]
MLRRDFVDSPVPVASEEEVYAFDAKKHPGPSKSNFRLHLSGHLISMWNKKAAAVFADDFVSIGLTDFQDKMQIQRMFLVHLITLRAQHRKLCQDGQEPSQLESPWPTEYPLFSVFVQLRERRSSAVGTHSHFARFRKLWDTIPYTAMSGDESDHSGGKVRYVVTRLNWRSSEFETWLKVFDWMHLSSRFTAESKPKRGAFPRYRRRGSRRLEQLGAPVAGLPRNCYDERWLAGLGEVERVSLSIQPAVDLVHSDQVMAFVSLTDG